MRDSEKAKLSLLTMEVKRGNVEQMDWAMAEIVTL